MRHRKPHFWPVFALLGLYLPLALGCQLTLQAGPVVPPGKPVRWILVERPCGEIGDRFKGFEELGRLEPGSTLLTFEQVYEEAPPPAEVFVSVHPMGVELVSLSPRQSARPGQVVTAVVRVVDAHPGKIYRLTVRPSREGVSILDDASQTVQGRETAAFRFTRASSGQGGLVISVELDSEHSF